jgi:hypothetical protein
MVDDWPVAIIVRQVIYAGLMPVRRSNIGKLAYLSISHGPDPVGPSVQPDVTSRMVWQARARFPGPVPRSQESDLTVAATQLDARSVPDLRSVPWGARTAAYRVADD